VNLIFKEIEVELITLEHSPPAHKYALPYEKYDHPMMVLLLHVDEQVSCYDS